MHRKQVAVAMSGGVDSSVAAALLKKANYDVIGVHMQLWVENSPPPDLEQTCRLLDIPLYNLDFRSDFKNLVIDSFCRGYSQGYTPNPCTTCNRNIKFGLLLDKVLGMGVDYLATGHYARVEHLPGGYRLLKGADLTKDQSYFLYTLGQKQLEHVLLPMGTMRKVEVRRLADELGLSVSNKKSSRDICFIPDGDYRSFIANYVPLEAGEIADTMGKVLGKHKGLAGYTVGQRHRLRIAASERLYVLKLDTVNNRLVVGARNQLLRSTLIASNLSWVSGEAPGEPITVMAKIRYRSADALAELYPKDRLMEVRFQQPQFAITPGQAIVFYAGDAVLGGGIIEASD